MSRRSWTSWPSCSSICSLPAFADCSASGQLALELRLADLALAGLHAHLVERALHQRLVALHGGHLLGQLRACRLALAEIGREQVAIEEGLLQVGC